MTFQVVSAQYTIRMTTLFLLKKDTETAKLSVLDSMPFAIAHGLNEKRYYLHPEERKKDKEIVDKLYRIVAETENKVERRRRIHDAIFTYCEK